MSKVVTPASRLELAEFPGGIMFELGCHVLDLVIGILGVPAKVTPFSTRVLKSDDTLIDNMLIDNIRGEKLSDFSYEHDLTVQRTLLKSCGLPPEAVR